MLLLSILFAITSVDIVYIGDSHSTGCFGTTLDTALRSRNFTVRTSATCGSSSHSWLRPGGNSTKCGYYRCDKDGHCVWTKAGTSPSLEALLQQSGPPPKPGLTVVELGTNMLADNWSRTQMDVLALIDKIQKAGSRCVWIGPPQAALRVISQNQFDEFNLRLKQTVEDRGCQFVNSSDKTDRQKITDPAGLHYNCKEATAWANQVLKEL